MVSPWLGGAGANKKAIYEGYDPVAVGLDVLYERKNSSVDFGSGVASGHRTSVWTVAVPSDEGTSSDSSERGHCHTSSFDLRRRGESSKLRSRWCRWSPLGEYEGNLRLE